MRIDHKKLHAKYGKVSLLNGFWMFDIDQFGITTTVAIGADVFRYQVVYQDGSGADICEDYIDYADLKRESVNVYDLKAIAHFIVERGESYEIHEEACNIEAFLVDAEIVKLGGK